MKIKVIFSSVWLLLCLLCFLSCQQEMDDVPGVPNPDPVDELDSVPAVFIPTIGDHDPGAASRAYNNMWESGDRVGIYMIDGTMPSANLDVDAAGATLPFRNIQYQAAAGGTSVALTSVTTQITFPSTGTAVNFVAYSPYNSGIAAAAAPTYPVNVTTQTTQKNIDLIHHLGTTDYTRATPNVSLAFTHKLSKIKITVAKDPTSADFTPATLTYECNLIGFPRQANFNLVTGGLTSLTNPSSTSLPLKPLFNKLDSKAGSLVFEGILVPHTGSAYPIRSFTIKLDSTTYTYDFPTTHNFVTGQQYEYKFSLLGAQLALTGNTITNWGTGETYYQNIVN